MSVVIEDVNRNLRAGDTLELIKKEQRKIKVAENREEPFKKEGKTVYVKNENNRSKIDNWRNDMRARGYVRSDSYLKFFRTVSKNNYVRER